MLSVPNPLLIGSMILGFMGLTTEMGLAIGAGAIGLAFLNLEQIASLKGAGIELVTKETREQIQAVIEKETESSLKRIDQYFILFISSYIATMFSGGTP